jgi:hypothetical protein
MAVIVNAGDRGSFFQSERESPSSVNLISDQVDPSAPLIRGLTSITDPVIPAANAQSYVKNFDPELYDLRDSSHLMRLIRAMTGAAGLGGLRKQYVVGRLSAMLGDGAFLDLDTFYGALFGLQRHAIESMPTNADGVQINPYTDMADSDTWDDVLSRDARYRSRIFQLARAINMGATVPGIRGAAEAVINADVEMVESWVKTDYYNDHVELTFPSGYTYGAIKAQRVTYGGTKQLSYSELTGSQFGAGSLPTGNRGELIFTPSRLINDEERYQLSQVLNTLTPAHTQVTIATRSVSSSSVVRPRRLFADSENWQIQARVTPAIGLITPDTPVYQDGTYSQPRPVFSEYSGERWSYNGNVIRATSYQLDGNTLSSNHDEESVVYTDGVNHTYSAPDAVMDKRQAIGHRLSGEGVVTVFPYGTDRSVFSGQARTSGVASD